MTNIDNIIDKVIEDKPSEVKSLLHQELTDRINIAMERKKPEIANKLFKQKQPDIEDLEDTSEENPDETDNGDK